MIIFLSLLIGKDILAKTIEPHKLLIPGETFRNENQKENEIDNYNGSGVSYEGWRQRKCYKKAFVIFQNSKLCTHDPHLCAQDYAVDEIHFFQRYKKLLNKISDVCAKGYPLDYQDRKVIKGNSIKEVEEFIVYLKKKKKVDYNNPPTNKFVNVTNSQKEKTKKRPVQTGAHGAIPAPKDSDIGQKVTKLNAVPVEPVAVKNIENSKQNENKKSQVNEEELKLLKKQVENLKKAERKKQQEIEKLRKAEKKRLKELEDARQAEKKRLKELEAAKKAEKKRQKELEAARMADEKRQKELRNITTKVETKDMELEKTRKADEEKRRQLELAKKQLNYVKKELESIQTEEADNLKKELDEMTRGDDIECVGKVEFQMECVEKNDQGERYYYELKKIGNFICSKLKITENNYSDNSYRKIYGEIVESDARKGRFIVSEYGSTGENKENIIYDFNQKQKFMDIDDPFSFEKCK
ncbi:MAG: hypothetical protein CL572_01250 [Alphaproteobacteria bacterium]|nr:hypothetical protein [Alphaproteobacteria bacterium]